MKPSEFLHELWGASAPGAVLCWQAEGRRSTWLVGDLAGADDFAGRADAYTRVSTLPRPLGPEKRGGAGDSYALAGLWMDLDLGDEERPRKFRTSAPRSSSRTRSRRRRSSSPRAMARTPGTCSRSRGC